MTDVKEAPARESDAFAMWAILELMGHRRLAGFVTEATIGGASFIRIDVPDETGNSTLGIATQFYSPSAVYCITPTTKEIACHMATTNRPAPVKPWELPPPARNDLDLPDDDEDDPDVEELLAGAARPLHDEPPPF